MRPSYDEQALSLFQNFSKTAVEMITGGFCPHIEQNLDQGQPDHLCNLIAHCNYQVCRPKKNEQPRLTFVQMGRLVE